MLVNVVLSLLTPIRGLVPSRQAVGNWIKVSSALAAGVGGGLLLLLCACAGGKVPAAMPTASPLSATAAVPTLLLPTQASLPSPTPSSEPAERPPAEAPTATDEGPSAADVSVHASEPVHPVPGQAAVYTLTVRNRGPGWATGLVLTDVFPSAASPVWAQPGQPLCGREEGSVNCDLGALQGGDAFTVTLDLSTGGAETLMPTTGLAGVSLDLSRPTCVIDRDSVAPLITCRLPRLQPGGAAAIRVGADVDGGASGVPVHTVAVTANEPDTDRSNNGGTFALTGEAAGPAPGPIERPLAATSGLTATADLVVRAHGPSSVVAGRPFTVTYTISNQGALEATGVSFEGALPPATTLLAYEPGLPRCQVGDNALTCYLRDPWGGETITFTLIITGHGGGPVVMGPDPLMPGWPICSVLKERTYLHIVTCDFGSLKSGGSVQVELVLVAEGIQERALINTVSASAHEEDPTPLDNTSTTTVTVQVSADLALRSTLSGPARPGGTLSYTLTVANLGPSDAADVVLVDVPPVGTTLVSAVASQGEECRVEQDDDLADILICALGRLAGGTAASVAFVFTVDESLPRASAEALSHSASVVSGQPDPNSGDNEVIESVPVSVGIEG